MGKPLPLQVEEERTWEGPLPDDWPKARRMRYELFNGGADLDRWPGTGLYVAMKAVRELGYVIDKDGRTYRARPRPRRGRPPKAPLLRKAAPPVVPVADKYRTKPEPPSLGANVVVFALLAHNGDVVVGFAEQDGRQWFAVLTEPPT